MATTAIFGQAVYGDSRYGVLLVSGTSNTAFNTKGSVQGSGRLIGTATISTDAFGQGQALGIRQIYGSSTLSFEGLSGLRGKTALKSSSNTVFSSFSSIAGLGNILGNSSLVFLTNTQIKATGNLFGSNSLFFDTTGSVRGRGRTRGNTSLNFNLSGYLNRFVIQGSTTVSFNLKNNDYTLETNLPWYNTIDTNNNLPYDDSNLSVYYNLYENTQGEILLPYQRTEEEIV